MKKSLILVVSTILIVGCGGGGSSYTSSENIKKTKKKLTGYYIDSAVSGVNYNCETSSGVTGSRGEFKFEKGHNCRFSINKKELRTIKSDKLFDGIYVLEDNNKIASVLQTIDLDGNASNGVKIVPEATECINSSLDDINTSVLKECLDGKVSNYLGKAVSELEASQHIQQTIQKNRPTANKNSIVAKEDSDNTITLTGSDPQGDKITFVITKEPIYGSLDRNRTTGIVKYRPNINFNGQDSFKFKATDGTFESDETTVNITVKSVNDAPVANSDTATMQEDGTILVDVLSNDTDEDNDTLTILKVSKPANGATSIEGRKVKYIPTANYNGSDSFTYTISDGNGGSATANVNITVNPVNDTPIAKDISTNTDENVKINITLAGEDIDGDNLNYSIVKQPLHGTLSLKTDNAIYTPASNYNGSDSFIYRVSDGNGGSATATVNITVKSVNDAPVANSDTATMQEDGTILVDVLSNDTDEDNDTLTILKVSKPANGATSIEGRKVKYIPTANYNGSDSFTYTISDGNGGSATANVNITVNPVNDTPIAKDISTNTDENVKINITLAGEDIDGDSLSYSITKAPLDGNVTISGNIVTYTPNDGYSGVDSFKYKANDGKLDSNEATVSVDITSTNIHITENYKVIPLGSNTTINKKIYLDSSAKNLYLVFSNKGDTNSSTATVSHNANVAVRRENVIVGNKEDKSIKYPPNYITDFNKKSTKSLIKNSGRNLNIVATPKSNLVVGDTHTFYLSTDKSVSTEATLKSVISNVDTNVGTRTLNVWVSNDSFGSGCPKATCVTQTMVDELADRFLKSGSNNDIYDWVTNIYGSEWGSLASSKYSNVISQTDTIDILLTDIDQDNRTSGGVVGYFWSKDNFLTSQYSGSNERIMFYADSVMFANTSNGDYWQKILYSTLAHELQHMINFYQKNIVYTSGCETWLNEMMSVSTEDLLTTKLEHDGARAVKYTDGTAGASGNTNGRFPIFNKNNDITLTNWNQTSDVLNDYSKVSSFGAFLLRNYGGAELMHNIMDNNFSDENAIIDAVKTTTGKDVTFVNILQEWGIAVMLSSIDNLVNAPQYNFGDFLSVSYGGVSYDLGSINFFNYNPLPKLHTTMGPIEPHANYYYKIGENITSSSIDLNISLDANTEATLIAK